MSARHEEIADALRRAIDRGEYPVGGTLPTESDLAARYEVSRGTVRQAVAALTSEGRIGSRQGARRVVLGNRRSQSFAELRSFAQWARAMGRTATGRVVEQHRRPATADDVERLLIEPGTEVLQVLRVRGLDGEPVLVERNVYPPWVAGAVEGLPPECESVVQALYDEIGIIFAYGEHTIDAVGAGTQDADLLGIRRGGPLLRIRRTTTTHAGRPIEWSDDRYRSGSVSFAVANSIGSNPLARHVG
ncbi:GntR family transcriptional regulator [Streptacidiphilus cavernicola]|uniref:GntR family transcriptional regulator n=1 Tax=Streptacidiphilus cavernicola TaxID=3342716 RepID=A0ABV6VTQ4_9ACTN